MNVVAIVQAHMGSTRLPGKVLRDIGGQTMLAWVVRRSQRASLLNEVTVACSTLPDDDAIVEECSRLGVRCYRGSDGDVLDRFHGAALAFGADSVVRITSDCPLIEPEVVDKVIAVFLRSGADYASNTIDRSYPRGLDTEAFKKSCLDRAWSEAHEPHQRAHVTPYFYEMPELFKNVQVRGEVDISHLRWTVDTKEDYDFVSAIYSHLSNQEDFTWRDVLALIHARPNLGIINQHVQHKTLREL